LNSPWTTLFSCFSSSMTTSDTDFFLFEAICYWHETNSVLIPSFSREQITDTICMLWTLSSRYHLKMFWVLYGNAFPRPHIWVTRIGQAISTFHRTSLAIPCVCVCRPVSNPFCSHWSDQMNVVLFTIERTFPSVVPESMPFSIYVRQKIGILNWGWKEVLNQEVLKHVIGITFRSGLQYALPFFNDREMNWAWSNFQITDVAFRPCREWIKNERCWIDMPLSIFVMFTIILEKFFECKPVLCQSRNSFSNCVIVKCWYLWTFQLDCPRHRLSRG
jgi:hypothetical protein